MKQVLTHALLFLALCWEFSAAQEQPGPMVVSVKPQIDIPLPPDSNLFQVNGGITMSVRKLIPFISPLSIGVAANYHLGRLQHKDLENPGSLSMISGEIIPKLRWTLWNTIDTYLSGSAGYFCAFQNGGPSSYITNLVWSGRIGVDRKVNQTLAMSLQCEYRKYQRLYHFLGVGFGLDLFWEMQN